MIKRRVITGCGRNSEELWSEVVMPRESGIRRRNLSQLSQAAESCTSIQRFLTSCSARFAMCLVDDILY